MFHGSEDKGLIGMAEMNFGNGVVFLNNELHIIILRLAIGHELKHIKQLESQELKECGNETFFLGKPMKNIPYSQRPYEIEARKTANRLFWEWCKMKLIDKLKRLLKVGHDYCFRPSFSRQKT